jgi:hypothetical protein
MARALLPASFVREAPTNNQGALALTATGHCLVLVLPKRAKTSFPGRGAAPLRFAASSAWLQKGSWAGLRSANANASAATPTRAGAGPLRRLGLCDPPQQPHCPPTHATGREGGPGNTGNGSRETFQKRKNTESACGDRLPPLRRWLLCAGVRGTLAAAIPQVKPTAATARQPRQDTVLFLSYPAEQELCFQGADPSGWFRGPFPPRGLKSLTLPT